MRRQCDRKRAGQRADSRQWVDAEKGQASPPPFVPYALVALPILLGVGIVLAIKRNVGGG